MAVSESGTYPETFTKSRGKTLYRYNIHEVEVVDLDGGTHTVYRYNEVAIEGKVTKAKILEAIRLADLEIAGEGDAATEYREANTNTRLAEIADMTYAELETYIDNNVTDLSSAKVFLKKLGKVVLALLKRLSL